MMLPTLDEFKQAQQRIAALLSKTPLERSERLSNYFKADVYLKREDLQQVRSYKIRGAFNKLLTLSQESKVDRVICASAGNHAQGVAFKLLYFEYSWDNYNAQDNASTKNF